MAAMPLNIAAMTIAASPEDHENIVVPISRTDTAAINGTAIGDRSVTERSLRTALRPSAAAMTFGRTHPRPVTPDAPTRRRKLHRTTGVDPSNRQRGV